MTSAAAAHARVMYRRKRDIAPWLSIIVFGLLWEVSARYLTDAFVLAAPSDVLRYLGDEWRLLTRALGVTLGRAALGFVIGNLSAILLAGIALVWPRTERIVTGLALLVFCLPLVATGPILRVLFGSGDGPQIVLAALAVYYTTLIPLLVGLRAAPDSWFDLVRSYGRGRMAALVHVRAMASLPYLFTGLQSAAPAAFLGAMVGEFTGAERGMGVLTIRAIRALDVDMTWALATVATAVAIFAYVAIGALAKRVLLEKPPVILATPAPGGPHRSAWRTVSIVTILALVSWSSAIHLLNLNAFFAKSPSDVFAALFVDSDARDTRAALTSALAESALFLVPGYLAGRMAGAGLAGLLVLLLCLLPMQAACKPGNPGHSL